MVTSFNVPNNVCLAHSIGYSVILSWCNNQTCWLTKQIRVNKVTIFLSPMISIQQDFICLPTIIISRPKTTSYYSTTSSLMDQHKVLIPRRPSSYPVLMTLGISNRKTRQSVSIWRPIGFYSKASIDLSKAQKRKLSKEPQYGPFDALEDNNFQLDYIFDELVGIQKPKWFLHNWNTGVNNRTIH